MTKILIIFAYKGFQKGDLREKHFWDMLKIAQRISGDTKPVVVYNEDTCERGQAKAFLEHPNYANLDVVKVWSVDTCQMWLTGWGHIIDEYPETDRIVQLPGDIDMVADETDFYSVALPSLIGLGDPFDIIVGDFKIRDRFGAKNLIDQYGTYPLLATWFQELTRAIFNLPLNRPRSEYLNIRTTVLRDLLKTRKFAYEQTLNMLLNAWDFQRHEWKYKIQTANLGYIKDDNTERQYLGALDQIERTERLLKLRWREIYKPEEGHKYKKFLSQYNTLDRHSASVREGGRITIQALLGIKLYDMD